MTRQCSRCRHFDRTGIAAKIYRAAAGLCTTPEPQNGRLVLANYQCGYFLPLPIKAAPPTPADNFRDKRRKKRKQYKATDILVSGKNIFLMLDSAALAWYSMLTRQKETRVRFKILGMRS